MRPPLRTSQSAAAIRILDGSPATIDGSWIKSPSATRQRVRARVDAGVAAGNAARAPATAVLRQKPSLLILPLRTENTTGEHRGTGPHRAACRNAVAHAHRLSLHWPHPRAPICGERATASERWRAGVLPAGSGGCTAMSAHVSLSGFVDDVAADRDDLGRKLRRFGQRSLRSCRDRVDQWRAMCTVVAQITDAEIRTCVAPRTPKTLAAGDPASRRATASLGLVAHTVWPVDGMTRGGGFARPWQRTPEEPGSIGICRRSPS